MYRGIEMDFKKRYKSHHDSTTLLKDKFTKNIDNNLYLKELLNKKSNKARAIYIHVPYCSKICSFCNLNTALINNSICNYHELIIDSIKQISNYNYIQSKEFESIYFGGGTPTTLSPDQLEQIFDALYSYLPISEKAEISLETSISELTEERLEVLYNQGVNRFSIGVQSFNDRARQILGRRGSGEKAAAKIKKVMERGFKNTNIDLIYNYPGQTLEEINYDLKLIDELDIAGLSFYSLILHEGSKLYKQIKKDNIYQLPSIEKEKYFFEQIYLYLKNNGYQLFELTKMVKQGRDKYKYIDIKNNGGDVLALGLDAGGRMGQYIYYNGNNIRMLKHFKGPISPRGRVVTEKYDFIYKILGQIQFGKINFDYYSLDLGKELSSYFKDLEKKELIIRNNNAFSFSKEGLFWGNNISCEITKLLIKYFKSNSIQECI